MDPATVALLIKAVTLTALQVRDIFKNSGLTDEEQEACFVELVNNISANAKRTYSDYDPDLDADLANSEG